MERIMSVVNALVLEDSKCGFVLGLCNLLTKVRVCSCYYK